VTLSRRRMLALGLVAYAAALVIVLLNPSPAVGSELIDRVARLGVLLHLPAPLVAHARIDFGLNVLAFMPLVLLGSLLRPTVSVSAWTAAGFGASVLVEAVQLALPDRLATHADVVANTLGAALGAGAAWVVRRAVRQKLARISPTGSPPPSRT
jgi:VanZ family protein